MRHSGVDVERDRRLAVGVTVTVTGYGDIPLQGRANDQINLLALRDTARDLKAAAVTGSIIPFRAADNSMHMLNADQMLEMSAKGKIAASAIYQAAWDLKEMATIPPGFIDDIHWP